MTGYYRKLVTNDEELVAIMMRARMRFEAVVYVKTGGRKGRL
jgi:hypothetical protein